MSNKNSSTKCSLERVETLFRIIFVPTLVFTENSEHKIVRALGRIGTVIPFLPLTMLAIVLLTVLDIFYELRKSVQSKLKHWWESV